MRCSIPKELDTLDDFIKQKGQLHCSVVQGLDLRGAEINWQRLDFHGAVFLGCTFPKEVTVEYLMSKGAVVFPRLPALPYDPYRSKLYSRDELMEGWTPKVDKSTDKRIYDHFIKHGGSKSDIFESLAQRLHDHAMDDGLRDLLEGRIDNDGEKKVVGIMGGHSTSRNDPFFKKVVRLARDLSDAGYFVASGGGPGTMEAANLGAWLKGVDDEGLEKVFELLDRAPDFNSSGYVDAARKVLDLYPNGGSSVAIPTWFYGHEPTNLFSKHIAKYFSNSIREDGLLAIASHGVVFAPGSAGTTQEIFMDATQNHYLTYGSLSPMVFLGEQRYTKDTMLFPCVKQLAENQAYAKMLYCTDDVQSIVSFIQENPPEKVR